MSNDINNIVEAKPNKALAILGAMHLIITVTLGWALSVKLTPPNKPVENGLEVLFPGAVILLLGVPFALAGVVLARQRVNAVKSVMQMDITVIVIIMGLLLLIRNIWVGLAALPFIADLAALLVITRRLS